MQMNGLNLTPYHYKLNLARRTHFVAKRQKRVCHALSACSAFDVRLQISARIFAGVFLFGQTTELSFVCLNDQCMDLFPLKAIKKHLRA